MVPKRLLEMRLQATSLLKFENHKKLFFYKPVTQMYRVFLLRIIANIAQPVEQLTRNEQVGGSSPPVGSL